MSIGRGDGCEQLLWLMEGLQSRIPHPDGLEDRTGPGSTPPFLFCPSSPFSSLPFFPVPTLEGGSFPRHPGLISQALVTDSLEKTHLLAKIEGGRRRG